MIPSMIEKLGYIVTVVALYSQARISNMDASTALPDGLLLILFFAAFMKTRGRRYSAPTT
jgi:hypothetical protein